MQLPSGHDVFAVTGDSNGYPSAALDGRLVSDFGVNLTMLEFVAVQIDVDEEVVEALEIDVSIGHGEAVWCFDLPFA